MSQAKKTTTPKRSKTSESQILPPYKVCGGKAVGFHFGVNTCAACKVRQAIPMQFVILSCLPPLYTKEDKLF